MTATKTIPTKKTGLQELSESRGTIYNIDPRKIETQDGFNVRQEMGDMESLKSSIKFNGVKNPLIVFFKEGRVFLSSGHRRLSAVMDLIKDGSEFKSVPCISEPKNYNEENRTADLIVANDGKPLTPLEESLVIQRLVNFGWTPQQISEKTGRTQAHISNMRTLAGLPSDIQNKIKDNKVSSTLVLEMARESGDKIEKLKEKLDKAINVAESSGKKKATKKHIEKSNDIPQEKSTVKKFDMKKVLNILEKAISAYKEDEPTLLSEAFDDICILRDEIAEIL